MFRHTVTLGGYSKLCKHCFYFLVSLTFYFLNKSQYTTFCVHKTICIISPRGPVGIRKPVVCLIFLPDVNILSVQCTLYQCKPPVINMINIADQFCNDTSFLGRMSVSDFAGAMHVYCTTFSSTCICLGTCTDMSRA